MHSLHAFFPFSMCYQSVHPIAKVPSLFGAIIQNSSCVYLCLPSLQVFESEGKGFGVRAGEDISKGTYICSYLGT